MAAADPETWTPKERTMLQRIADGDRPDKECLKKKYIGGSLVVYNVDGIKFGFLSAEKGMQIGRYW